MGRTFASGMVDPFGVDFGLVNGYESQLTIDGLRGLIGLVHGSDHQFSTISRGQGAAMLNEMSSPPLSSNSGDQSQVG